MHVPLTTLDFLHRAEGVYGARSAVIDEPNPPGGGLGTITYSELARRARSLAVGFDDLGLDAGERIAILSPNAGRFLIALFGIPAHGRVLVPINFRLNRDEIAYIIEHSGATEAPAQLWNLTLRAESQPPQRARDILNVCRSRDYDRGARADLALVAEVRLHQLKGAAKDYINERRPINPWKRVSADDSGAEFSSR